MDSCLVSVDPLPPGTTGIENRAIFDRVVKGLFEHRRKTCYNSLRMSRKKGACRGLIDPETNIDEALEKAFSTLKIDPNARPEQLYVATFIELANYFERRRS